MRWVVVSMWLSACCLPCGGDAPTVKTVGGETASLAGRALVDGKPVAVFDVRLDDAHAAHFTDGGFFFGDLAPGHYDVVVLTPDHRVGRETRFFFESLAPGTAVSGVDVALSGATWVHGRVLGPDGAPLPGARVEAEVLTLGGCRDCVVTRVLHETTTGADGTYALDGLDAPDGYLVRASAAGLLANEQPVAGASKVREQVLDLRLSRARSDGGESSLSMRTSLRGVVLPEDDDARLISVDGIEVQQLGRFVAADLIALDRGARLMVEDVDGGRRVMKAR